MEHPVAVEMCCGQVVASSRDTYSGAASIQPPRRRGFVHLMHETYGERSRRPQASGRSRSPRPLVRMPDQRTRPLNRGRELLPLPQLVLVKIR